MRAARVVTRAVKFIAKAAGAALGNGDLKFAWSNYHARGRGAMAPKKAKTRKEIKNDE
jgi:hypothetical protein